MENFVVYEDLATPRCDCGDIAVKKMVGAANFKHSHPTKFLCKTCFDRFTAGKETRKINSDIYSQTGYKGLKTVSGIGHASTIGAGDTDTVMSRMEELEPALSKKRKSVAKRKAELEIEREEEVLSLTWKFELQKNLDRILNIPTDVREVKLGNYFYQVKVIEGKNIGYHNGEPKLILSEDLSKIIGYV